MIEASSVDWDISGEKLQKSNQTGPPEPGASSRLALKIVETGQMLPLSTNGEFTLGRISEEQPLSPDIDLSPFRGYETGVSRLHATIKVEGTSVWVTDLGSSNGTAVNGERISPHQPARLAHGDILSLANFRLRVYIR